MAGNPKLVNKQFNSPIGLYSDANVREILDRESQLLANGAVGINFHNPMSNKPANLQNSAVLRMLEEEENRQRNGQSKGFRRDGIPLRAWPPPGVNNRQRRFQDVIISGVKRVAWPPPKEGDDEFSEQEAVQAQGGPQYSTQQPCFSPTTNHQQHLQQQQAQHQQQQHHQPQLVRPGQSPTPALANQPPAYHPQSPTPTSPISVAIGQPQQHPRTWAPVQPPQSPTFNTQHTLLLQQVPQHQQQLQQSSPGCIRPQSPQAYNPNAQLQQPPAHQQQPQHQQSWTPAPAQPGTPKPQQFQQQGPPPQQQQQQQKTFEPPPTTIQLRPTVPISQAPAPIVTSQPATATLKGGKNLRGDLKWPPENVKERMDAENRQRMELAKGPACRPRRVQKDYSGFFAQHALNSSYPGYKIPPGTQFYDHHPMM